MYDLSIVSVIIPAYNSEAYLECAVASALAQVDGNIEVIVIDDGSTDRTLEIAKSFEQTHSEVRVLKNLTTVGPSESRNKGIELATGEWIALLDADDHWHPERLKHLQHFFPDSDVVSDDVVIEPGNHNGITLLTSTGFKIFAPISLDALDVARYQLGLLKPLIRRSFLIEHGIRYDPSLRIGEDFCLFIELLLAGARWRQIPDAYYVYRRRRGSLTNDRQQHVEGRLRSDSVLLTRPEVRREPELVRVLEKRVQRLQEFATLLAVLELAADRKWRAIARWATSERRLAPLVVGTAARHGYHWAKRRLRAFRPAGGTRGRSSPHP